MYTNIPANLVSRADVALLEQQNNDGGKLGLERMCALHFRDYGSNADKVWGAVVQSKQDPKLSLTQHRYVAFWGRRGRGLNLSLGKWTDDWTESSRQHSRALVAKLKEGYRPIDWRDGQFGMYTTVRELANPSGESIALGGDVAAVSLLPSTIASAANGRTKRESKPEPKKPAPAQADSLLQRKKREIEID